MEAFPSCFKDSGAYTCFFHLLILVMAGIHNMLRIIEICGEACVVARDASRQPYSCPLLSVANTALNQHSCISDFCTLMES